MRPLDGRRRLLITVTNHAFAPGSGLDELTRSLQERALVHETFAELGYTVARDLVNRDAGEIRAEIADALHALGPDDVVALYVSTHAELLGPPGDRSLALHTSRSRSGRRPGTLQVADLLEGLESIEEADRPRNLLFVLDVCFAAAGLPEAMRSVRAAVPPVPTGADGAGVHVLAVTGPDRLAGSGEFAQAWRDALLSGPQPSREVAYLDFAMVAGAVQDRMSGQVVETLSLYRRGQDLCLPNPRHHLDGVDPGEMSRWWEPRARALPLGDTADSATQGWLFSGRRRLNRHLAAWIAGGSSDPELDQEVLKVPVLVLTGAPGSGKSTVLARLVALTVPDVRGSLSDGEDAAGSQEEVPPADFRFAATIWAARRSTDEIGDRVLRGLGLRSAHELNALAERRPEPEPPIVLIDALDEALEPFAVVREVLRPLAQAAHAGVVRLIVATRRQPIGIDSDVTGAGPDLISPLLQGRGNPVDADSPRWLQTGDIADYCALLLAVPENALGRANPYATDVRSRNVMARAIEERARHSFLLASLVARRHTLDRECQDPTGPAWRTTFPEEIGAAMRAELHALYGPAEAAVRLAILRPLALAQGTGLSRDMNYGPDLWAAFATALAGPDITITPQDVDHFLTERVATFLIAQWTVRGGTSYRLHHEALAESFDLGLGSTESHSRIVDLLLGTVTTSWDDAGPYFRRALPHHALRAGRLGPLADAAQFLVECDPDQVHAALTNSPDGLSRATLLRPYLHRLPALTSNQRAFLLGVAASGAGVAYLSRDLLTHAGLGVHAVHLELRPEPQRQVLAEGRPVEAVACTTDRDGAPRLFLPADPYIEVWEPGTGTYLDALVTGLGEVTTLLPGTDEDGFPVLFAGGRNGAEIWDVTTRARRRRTAGAFARGLVAKTFEAEPVVVGWTEEHIDVWHPATGDLRRLPVVWEPGKQPISDASLVRSGDGQLLVAVAAGGCVSFWNAKTGTFHSMVLPPDEINIRLTALNHEDGDWLLIVTGLSDRTGLLWSSDGQTRPWPFLEIPLDGVGWTGIGGPCLVIGHLDGAVTTWRPSAPADHQILGQSSMLVQALAVGPTGSEHPRVAASDRLGVVKTWDLDGRPGPTLSAGQAHAFDIGALGDGHAYLAVGRNDGADIWRLDDDAEPADSERLHAGEANRVASLTTPDGMLVATTGDDGTLRLWLPDGSQSVLAVPTGPVDALILARWGTRIVTAVSAMGMLLLHEPDHPTQPARLHESSGGPMAVNLGGGAPLLAAAAKTRVLFFGEDRELLGAVDVPPRFPGASEDSTTSQRMITAMCWSPVAAGHGQELIVATAGGLVFAIGVQQGELTGARGLVQGRGVVLHLLPMPGPRPSVLVAGLHGGLHLVDVDTGAVVADLTRDDARVQGAVLLDDPAGEPLLVTSHSGGGRSGLRFWSAPYGDSYLPLVRSPEPSDVYLGRPCAGRDRTGRPFLAYVAGDDVEIVRWSGVPQITRLPLPFVAYDVTCAGSSIVVAGGGGRSVFAVD